MDSSVLLGGSAIAAVVAGTIALLAPCCFSVMLPAYFASSVQNRRALVGMTFLFAVGVATVILPLALGAVALRRLLVEGHTYVYVGGGIVVLALAAYTLAGGELRLPMPGRAPGRRAGPWGVYTLGTFSGVASACCAPVLAGVVALAGVGGSLAVGAGLAWPTCSAWSRRCSSWPWPGTAGANGPHACSGRAPSPGASGRSAAASAARHWPAACYSR